MLWGAQAFCQVWKRSSKIESNRADLKNCSQVSVEAGQKDHLEEDMEQGRMLMRSDNAHLLWGTEDTVKCMLAMWASKRRCYSVP